MQCCVLIGNLKKDDIWTQSRQNLEEAIEEEKENTSHRWDPDLLTQEQRLDQRLDKLNLDMYIMGSDGACQVIPLFLLHEPAHAAALLAACKQSILYMSAHRLKRQQLANSIDLSAACIPHRFRVVYPSANHVSTVLNAPSYNSNFYEIQLAITLTYCC